jgi:hypothetical protein
VLKRSDLTEIISKLNSIGQDKNDVLNQSIENSYRGVFALKNNNGNNKEPILEKFPVYIDRTGDPFAEEMA